MIAIVFIVVMFLIFFKYWAGVDFGIWHLFLIIAGAYGIYANLKTLKNYNIGYE